MEIFGLIFFSLHLLECHGKKIKNKAIVDVNERGRFLASERYLCNKIGGKLVSRKTLDKHLPCIKQTLEPLKQYWIGQDEDCNATGSNHCTFKLTKNKKPEYKKQGSWNMYFSLCEVDLSTYKNKRRLCPSEKSTKRLRTTPSMSNGDVRTTAYQTDSIPDAVHADRIITTMSMELSYDSKRMENIAIVDVQEEYSFNNSETECKNLGGSLVRRKTLQKYRSCLNESLDPLERYWIGKDKDFTENGLDLFTFQLKEGEPYFDQQRSKKQYFSLCEIDLSTYKNERRLCSSEESPKRPGATHSMSDSDVPPSVSLTESITDARHADETTAITPREQSYDDGEKAKNKTTILNVKTKGSFVRSHTYCKCLGGRLIRKKTLKIHLTCLKQFLDTFHQYWIGKVPDNSKSEQEFRTFTLKQNKEPKFEAKRSGFNRFSSLCEVGLSTYMYKRTKCKPVRETRLVTCPMPDGDMLTTAYQTESITDVSKANRTTTMMSMEQSHDDGPIDEIIICVVCLLMATFAIVLTVFVKKRRKRKRSVESKNVPRDPNIVKPTEMVPVPESESEHNQMLEESPYAELKESVTGINQASVPDTLKPDETDPNSLKPNKMMPVPVSGSAHYHILEESPYSKIKGSGAENCRNHQASECQESLTRDNEDETYDHLERNRSESRHGSEVDVTHPEIDNASEALLEDSCEVKAEKDYDHLELKEQSSNIEVFSEYSMTDDADYTDLSKRKPLDNPCSDYEHANLN